MRAYYNEHDPKKAAWLCELIADGQITEGDVDERSIEHVQPGDLRGYARCHFFAGIGVWDYALDLAGWGDEPVWSGSCPCQPFSAAGKGKGFDDAWHLWPAWFRLIAQCRPTTVIGEQVASADGLAWLDAVYADLEAAGYAVGAADLSAAGVGAPHIRQRLFFVADATGQRHHGRRAGGADTEPGSLEEPERLRDAGRLGYADSAGPLPGTLAGVRGDEEGDGPRDAESERRSRAGILADAESRGQREHGSAPGHAGYPDQRECVGEWLHCKDGKLRAVESVPESLADGTANLLGSVRYQGGRIFHPLQVKAPARRLRLHGYGDAIVAQVAAQFIGAFLSVSV